MFLNIKNVPSGISLPSPLFLECRRPQPYLGCYDPTGQRTVSAERFYYDRTTRNCTRFPQRWEVGCPLEGNAFADRYSCQRTCMRGRVTREEALRQAREDNKPRRE